MAALHDYYLLTGDAGFARRMLPVARRAVTYYTDNLDSNGLYTTKEPAINWRVIDVAQGEDTHTNAAIYRALIDLGDLERWVGAGKAAAWVYERQAGALGRAMIAHLWDPSAGAFVVNSSDPMHNHSQDAQVEAVYDGVIKGKQAARALEFIDDHLWTTYGVQNGQYSDDPYVTDYISPYISSTELLAGLKLDDAQGALDLMRREWGHMVDTDPNSTLWERMSLSGDASGGTSASGLLPSYTPNIGAGFTSLAHGWAGGPVPALSQYVLGIRPLAPGFSSWTVEPQVGDLRFAQGQAPTPHGVIVSRWRRGPADSSFVLTAGGPRGTSGEVAVPLLGAPRVIARDGEVVWNGRQAARGVRAWSNGAYVHFQTGPGLHTYAWSDQGRG